MPELPEVQIVTNQLSNIVNKKRITRIVPYRHNLRNDFDLEQMMNFSAKVIHTERFAKYILIHCDNHKTLVIHLGMSGRFTINISNSAQFSQCDKHNHYDIIISDGNMYWQIAYIDPRRFGSFEIINSNDLLLGRFSKIGIDPISDSKFTPQWLTTAIRSSNIKAKNFLISQKYINGIGNIYASEILFASRIHPNCIINKIDNTRIKELYNCIVEILNSSIKLGGSSIGTYVDTRNISGRFQSQHKVYHRHGCECYTCGEIIIKQIDQGRSTFFCPRCQLIY